MEYIKGIWGGESKEPPKPAEEEISSETQKTLDLVRETLGGLGDTFLRHSQSQFVESLNDELTRTAVNSLLSSVHDYRTGLEPESMKVKAVKTAEAQFHRVIKGSDKEPLLTKLHDLVITPEGEVVPAPKGELSTPSIESLHDSEPEIAWLENPRNLLNEKLKVLHELSKNDFNVPEEDLSRLEDLQGLIFDPSFHDPELLEGFGDYCEKLLAAVTYAASVNLSGSVMFQGVDVIQDFLDESNTMQELLASNEVNFNGRPGNEILCEIAGAFVVKYCYGPEAEQLVERGFDPKEIATLLDNSPDAGVKLLNVITPIDEAFRGIKDKWEVLSLMSDLPQIGSDLRELLADETTRSIGTLAFQHFMRSLDKIEGLTHGADIIDEGGIDKLYELKIIDEETGKPKDRAFGNVKPIETSSGPVNVPEGLLKDFKRSFHTVNGHRYKSEANLDDSKNPEDFIPLVEFLDDCLSKGISKDDLESALLYSFQSVFADSMHIVASFANLPGMLILDNLEGARRNNNVEYFFDFDDDGRLDIKAVSKQANLTIEGLEFGCEVEMTFNFGTKEDGGRDYTMGSTVTEYSPVAEIHDRMTPEEFEEFEA